ncbi:MAG: F0F1 ATP synthase subunit B [Armatimonadetes bacterium]|nr:F0F1 ATP synthase subunit B [Armatimonadota bacterium]
MQDLLHALHIEPRIMAAQVTGFILLWILLAKYLFKPVMALLKAREAELKAAYDKAAEERGQAERIRAEVEARLAEIQAEDRARIQAAVAEAQSVKDEMIAEARARAEETLRRGEEDLARERQKILAEMRAQTVDISLAAAGKIIGESLDEDRHRRLVNDFIDKLGSAKP